MRLDLDTLDIICSFVDDVKTLLACCLTCHALREIATKKLLTVRDVGLTDEHSIRVFHTFLFADIAHRSPYVRAIHLLIVDIDDGSRAEVARLVVEILKHAPYLEVLVIPHGDSTFSCLRNPEIHATIGKLSNLRELSIAEWSGYTEQILLTTRSPLKVLHVSLKSIWTEGQTPWMTPERLYAVIETFAPTLQKLEVTQRPIMLDPGTKGGQYPAMGAVVFSGMKGPPWMETLTHMFPNLSECLDLGDVEEALVDDTDEQVRVRGINKNHQATAARWNGLGTVVADTLTLYMLGLTCPVGHLLVNAFCAHLKDRLADVLRDSPPTHLKLTVMLSHGVGAFEELFPHEVVPRLTHLVLFVMYDNLDEEDRIDRFTMSSIQWTAFLDLVIGAIKHLHLTHLRLVVYYNIDLADELAPAYSKGFIRSLRDHNPYSIVTAIMDAVPSLRYVFLTFGGQFEVGLERPAGGPQFPRMTAPKGHWLTTTGWENDPEMPGRYWRLGDEAEEMMEDEGLCLSQEDEWMMELNRAWTEEETAPWEPSAWDLE